MASKATWQIIFSVKESFERFNFFEDRGEGAPFKALVYFYMNLFLKII